ncbi:phosphatase PAP2 family protein [Haloprofundus salinisoli]|uniref:phosphatase PAP2 family protein n=1 Tax=Haloprofundus salinisoli TaxID=2876193 RepID=UPI001CC8EE9A|nr:phosphatase PAP2 family protein [Haloprofundus salinisoli]
MNAFRLVPLSEALRGAIPPELAEWFVPLTELGGVAFSLALLCLLYWLTDRERAATLTALVFGGAALVVGLKGAFALPRPPVETALVVETGYGFPSGHAVIATVLYGGLAALVDVGRRAVRYAAATVLVVVVSLSRVVIGVHYVGDVLAGAALAAAFLWVALRVTRREPLRAFALAAGLGAVGYALAGPTVNAVTVFGASVGGALAWYVLEPAARPASRLEAATLALVGLPAVVGIRVATEAVGALFPLVFALSVLLVGFIVAFPVVVSELGGQAGVASR